MENIINDITTTFTSDLAYLYGPEARLRTATNNLKCTGTKLTNFADNTPMYVATLTTDEAVFAGVTFNYKSSNSYLNFETAAAYDVLLLSLSLSYRGIDSIANLSMIGDGRVENSYDISYWTSARPSINLKANIEFNSGDGTIGNPYTIK